MAVTMVPLAARFYWDGSDLNGGSILLVDTGQWSPPLGGVIRQWCRKTILRSPVGWPILDPTRGSAIRPRNSCVVLASPRGRRARARASSTNDIRHLSFFSPLRYVLWGDESWREQVEKSTLLGELRFHKGKFKDKPYWEEGRG
ncbi:hypothetical protein KM043_016285 [Ampulex compressa]|nr:hypothetical protein KM043_016285 [Ampulex compressa]